MCEELPIATITEEYSSLSGESDWVIRPIYENCKKARERGSLVDIPGIDIDLGKEEYIRRYVPSFVEQRVISTKRPELWDVLNDLQLDSYDPFEIMCRSHGVCGDNHYYVSRTPDKVIDPRARRIPRDIPNFNTSLYGWL
jgi:hypothetical protein